MKTLKLFLVALIALFSVTSFSQTTIDIYQTTQSQEYTVSNGETVTFGSGHSANYQISIYNRYNSNLIVSEWIGGTTSQSVTYAINDTVDLYILAYGLSSGAVSKDFYINVPNSNSSVGINEVSDITFSVYPNPTTNFLNISGDNVESVKVFDMKGRLVLSDSNTKIDVSSLQNGYYALFVNDTKPIRFIKQ